MRSIKYIVLHCTATAQNAKISAILDYWKNTLGWKSPGYHYIIEADGKVTNLQPIEKLSNGVAGHNSYSINISYIGGIDNRGRAIDNRTPEQKASMIKLVFELLQKFPNAKVQGHRDFPGVNKACPCFNAIPWWEEVVKEKNKQLRIIHPANNKEFLKTDIGQLKSNGTNEPRDKFII